MSLSVTLQVCGPRALFTDPLFRLAGCKHSYPVPTYEALKGVLESVYWKPTFQWIVKRVRVVNPIITEPVNVRPALLAAGRSPDGTSLATYTYLADVRYQVEAEMVANPARPDLLADWKPAKHLAIFERSLMRGGRMDVFLGTRECQADVQPAEFGGGGGAYDATPHMDLGLMFHGFDFPAERSGRAVGRFWRPTMRNGVIEFCPPKACPHRHPLGILAPSQRPLTAPVEEEGRHMDVAEAC